MGEASLFGKKTIVMPSDPSWPVDVTAMRGSCVALNALMTEVSTEEKSPSCVWI